jgi:ABC-type oligopeptide transport system ATPase subunit
VSKPQYIELENMGLCGIAGISGSGKSSTIRLIAAQLALMGAGIIIVDGHGSYSQETLAESCKPLSKAFIRPTATHDVDIISAFEYIRSIAENRLNGNDTSKNYYVLIADEIISILARIGDKQSLRIIETLLKFATDYRKTNVRVIIAAQNWTKDFIGSAAIRRSMNVTLLHRMATDVVALFSNNPTVKRGAPNLTIGQLYIISQTQDTPVRVKVPNISQDDLIGISQHLETVPAPYESFVRDETIISAPQSDISHISDIVYLRQTAQKWADEIRKSYDNNTTKAETIYSIFSVRPGSSKKYKLASKLYDAVIAKYENKT